MSGGSRLGSNICSLRKAYGETQEELGAILHVEKNTVSYYERGKREPNKDTMAEIAKHYMISVEELMFCDLSGTGKITVDNTAFWKNIDIILPIIKTENAMKNKHFERAYKYHKEFYEELHKVSLNNVDNIAVCFDEYLEAYDDETIKPEVAVNFLAIWNFILMMAKTPLIMKNRPAALMQIAARDSKAREIIDNLNPDFEKDVLEEAEGLNDPEIEDMLDELKMTIKRSERWSDLADYYIALQYIWNSVNNDLSWDFNRRVGVEMLNAFVSVGNIYAARFLKYNMDSMGISSQIVDDK